MVILKEMNYIVFRNRGRTALSVCIAALLVCCMSFYLGSIQTAESAEENLAQVIPVTAQVVSRSGARTVGFEIDENHFANLMKADIKDAVYTASACANFQEQYRAEDVQGADTSVTAVSGLSALVGMTEENIAFENGYDLSFLERAEPLCVVSQSYAAQYGLNSGDTLSMPFYVTRYNDDGFSLRYEHLGMQGVKIIGVYADSASGSAVPCSMIVSVPWLQTVVKENNLRFYYSSFRCALRDPMKLNDFKDAMRGAGFAKPDPNALDERHGDTLVVDDQLFIETAEKLEQNLKVLRWFLAPFFALVIVLVTLVTFLLLRSTRRDMAISLSLGRPKILSGCACFFGMLIANVCGCAVAVPILLCTAGLALGQILTICGLYLASSCVGVLLALILLLRFDALELLTKID